MIQNCEKIKFCNFRSKNVTLSNFKSKFQLLRKIWHVKNFGYVKSYQAQKNT